MRPNDDNGRLPPEVRPFRVLIIAGSQRRQYDCPGADSKARTLMLRMADRLPREWEVDYEDLGKLVRARIEMSRCKLIETLAEEVALALLKEFQTPRVRVRLRKLHIPVAGFSGIPEVEIERART